MTATAQLPADKPTMFESTVCTRCGGCGHYSFNMMTGSRCFKCNGRGRTMTKRGAAAQEHYRRLLSKRADELQPGDKVQDLGVPGIVAGGWREVISATLIDYTYRTNGEEITKPAVRIEAKGWSLANARPDELFRVAATREQRIAARDAALAYQETLTKQGKPRQR